MLLTLLRLELHTQLQLEHLVLVQTIAVSMMEQMDLIPFLELEQ
jgi:hypothetical protein